MRPWSQISKSCSKYDHDIQNISTIVVMLKSWHFHVMILSQNHVKNIMIMYISWSGPESLIIMVHCYLLHIIAVISLRNQFCVVYCFAICLFEVLVSKWKTFFRLSKVRFSYYPVFVNKHLSIITTVLFFIKTKWRWNAKREIICSLFKYSD